MKTLRKIHLYLGCIFAPILLFFTITGCLQTFQLHEELKSGYTPPKILETFAQVHMHQKIPVEGQRTHASFPFQVFVAVMSGGFVSTIILGIIMAFRSTKNLFVVWACLGAGFVLPLLLLILK